MLDPTQSYLIQDLVEYYMLNQDKLNLDLVGFLS